MQPRLGSAAGLPTTRYPARLRRRPWTRNSALGLRAAASPDTYRLGRILRSVQAAHDDAVLQQVADRLDAGMRDRLGALLTDDGDGTSYARLAADPGRVGLESLLAWRLSDTRSLRFWI